MNEQVVKLVKAVLAVERLLVDAPAKVITAGVEFQVALLDEAKAKVLGLKLVDGLTEQEAAEARRYTGKIPAIKLYRERTKVGLREAKEAVENWMQRNLGTTYVPNPNPPVSSGEATFDRY